MNNYDISKELITMSGEKVKASMLNDIQRNARLGIQSHLHINDSEDATNGHATKITTNEIVDNAITGAKIAPLAVGSGQIAYDSVTCLHIVNGTIGNINLADNCVGSHNIDTEVIQKQHIAKYAVDIMTHLNCKIFNLQFLDQPINLLHNLGHEPTGYLVISMDKPTMIYMSAKDATTMTLCSSEVNTNVTILAF